MSQRCQKLTSLLLSANVSLDQKQIFSRKAVGHRHKRSRGAAALSALARSSASGFRRAPRPTTQATLPSADHAAEITRLQREYERLRMERNILKKSNRDLCCSSEMRFRFIEDRRANYPVRILCEVLGVSLAAWMTSGRRPRGGAAQSHAAEPAGQSPISLSRKTWCIT
jgi:hypothetical protein